MDLTLKHAVFSPKEDVLNDYITPQTAREDYGAVFKENSLEVDLESTTKLRQQLKRKSA